MVPARLVKTFGSDFTCGNNMVSIVYRDGIDGSGYITVYIGGEFAGTVIGINKKQKRFPYRKQFIYRGISPPRSNHIPAIVQFGHTMTAADIAIKKER